MCGVVAVCVCLYVCVCACVCLFASLCVCIFMAKSVLAVRFQARSAVKTGGRDGAPLATSLHHRALIRLIKSPSIAPSAIRTIPHSTPYFVLKSLLLLSISPPPSLYPLSITLSLPHLSFSPPSLCLPRPASVPPPSL